MYNFPGSGLDLLFIRNNRRCLYSGWHNQIDKNKKLRKHTDTDKKKKSYDGSWMCYIDKRHFKQFNTFLGGSTSMQSRVVVDGVDDGINGGVDEVVKGLVVLNWVGIGVVGQGVDSVSTLQDALQYATKHQPKPSVTLYNVSPKK